MCSWRSVDALAAETAEAHPVTTAANERAHHTLGFNDEAVRFRSGLQGVIQERGFTLSWTARSGVKGAHVLHPADPNPTNRYSGKVKRTDL